MIAHVNDTDYSRLFFSGSGHDIECASDKPLKLVTLFTALSIGGYIILAKKVTEASTVLVVVSYGEEGKHSEIKRIDIASKIMDRNGMVYFK